MVASLLDWSGLGFAEIIVFTLGLNKALPVTTALCVSQHGLSGDDVCGVHFMTRVSERSQDGMT